MAEVIQKAKKGIKKDFFEVKAPLTATKILLYGGSAEDFNGKVVKLDLTRSLRGKSLELKFRVKTEGDKLEGVPIQTLLVGSYIRRMMRRGVDYVEDSFETECRDYVIKVKPFFITRRKVSRSVRKNLRETAKKFLIGHLKARNSEEIFGEIISNKLQRQLALKLKKIYPLALCEIRIFEIVKEIEKKNKEEKSEEEAT